MASCPARRAARTATLLLILASPSATVAATPASLTELAGRDAPVPSAKSRGDARKIVGGNLVTGNALRAVVGITTGGGTREPSCSGSLIGPDIVLTASHCVCIGVSRVVVFGNTPTVRDSGSSFYKVIDHRNARRCDLDDVNAGLDLALLRLANPAQGAVPLQLAPEQLVTSAKSFRIAGFGAKDVGSQSNDFRLREAQVRVISNSCWGSSPDRSLADEYWCTPNEEIVAGQPQPPDACKGDSGGPLLVSQSGTGTNASGRPFLLAGVTSRVRANTLFPSCGDGNVYERLTGRGRAWVRKMTAELVRPAQ